ncbi:AAA family ATPase [Granulicella sp. WH15]|uniref:sigma 54-interacting transcriptional regulator n=1 Tax=Granulicella sp. WH15 TaxID=2602070 RepID=UPI0013668679|nr:sigma 54-interacting transcriptional regulator [Granulicella sp. WH15]QHN02175.1 AAA family ATPase [Granulicella sp. WH15]
MHTPESNSSSRSQPRIFAFEPNRRVLQYIEETLGTSFSLHQFDQEQAFLDAFDSIGEPDLSVFAWKGVKTCAAMLQTLRGLSSSAGILLLTTGAEAQEIATAIELGATGFLQKPFSRQDLILAVQAQLPDERPEAAPAATAAPHDTTTTDLGDGTYFVRVSSRMRELESQARLVARSDIPILILGESGTGKEILAKYTHASSYRAKKMFLKVNCAAMPAELLESELFGHEQGAFTGAVRSKPGKFEICEGGSIFLDEIGEMPAVLQAKLLHVLQDGTYSRLGGRAPMKSNVRVIAATNIDIKTSMANKTFREDLYYRLNGFTLALPPLRERRDEIPTFARHFLEKGAAKYKRPAPALSDILLSALGDHTWPGNLRELENVMNRYLVIGDERSIIAELTSYAASRASDSPPNPPTTDGLKQLVRTLKGSAESAAIASMLEETKWNRKMAASKMQISYKALLYKIKQYDLAPRQMESQRIPTAPGPSSIQS